MKNSFEEEKNQEGSDEETYYGVGNFLLEVVKVFILAFIIIYPVRIFLFQPFFVQGASMHPNFDDGEYLIINELGYKTTNVGFDDKNFFTVNAFKELERGDTIVFRYPKSPKQFFIKRVIGLPSEKIEIKESVVKIYNDKYPEGFILDESEYISDAEIPSKDNMFMQMQEDEYFVMGDNRPASHDSRSWGALNRDKVIGKVLIRAWPFSRAGIY